MSLLNFKCEADALSFYEYRIQFFCSSDARLRPLINFFAIIFNSLVLCTRVYFDQIKYVLMVYSRVFFIQRKNGMWVASMKNWKRTMREEEKQNDRFEHRFGILLLSASNEVETKLVADHHIVQLEWIQIPSDYQENRSVNGWWLTSHLQFSGLLTNSTASATACN